VSFKQGFKNTKILSMSLICKRVPEFWGKGEEKALSPIECKRTEGIARRPESRSEYHALECKQLRAQINIQALQN